MVKGYKTINIKEELIEKIKNSDENKKEVEDGIFNLAGFVTKVLSEHQNNKYLGPIKIEGPTTEQIIKNAVKEALTITKRGNVATTDINAGLTKEDLKNALLGLESDLDMKMREMLKEVTDRM